MGWGWVAQQVGGAEAWRRVGMRSGSNAVPRTPGQPGAAAGRNAGPSTPLLARRKCCELAAAASRPPSSRSLLGSINGSSLVGLVVLAGGSHQDDEDQSVDKVAHTCTGGSRVGRTEGGEIRYAPPAGKGGSSGMSGRMRGKLHAAAQRQAGMHHASVRSAATLRQGFKP